MCTVFLCILCVTAAVLCGNPGHLLGRAAAEGLRPGLWHLSVHRHQHLRVHHLEGFLAVRTLPPLPPFLFVSPAGVPLGAVRTVPCWSSCRLFFHHVLVRGLA